MQTVTFSKTAALLLIVLICGCGPKFGLPRLCEPGTASEKLAAAKKFDPYPDPNIAPEIVGGRPLGFMNPREDPDATKRTLPPWQSTYPPFAAPYVAPASYYPSSTVIAPPPTAAPASTTAYPPPIVTPSSATRVPPPAMNSAPPTNLAPQSNSSSELVPLDYSKLPAPAPNPADYKTAAWPTRPQLPAYGTKIVNP